MLDNNLGRIVKVFQNEGYLVTLFRLDGSTNLFSVLKKQGAKFDRIVCAGGDGTLNSTVTGLMQIPDEKRPPIGFIPCGTTNDTGISYDLPSDPLKAAKYAVTGSAYPTDVGRCGNMYFTYVACFGEISAVSCYTSQMAKQIFGRASYIAEGIKAILKLMSYNITVTYDGGKTVSGDYLLGMVSNSKCIGGFYGIPGRDVDFNDGFFEVTLVKKPSNLQEFSKEIDCMILEPAKYENKPNDLVCRFKAKEMVFEADSEIQWVVDGENAGKHKEITIINENKAVRIVAGEKARESEKTETVGAETE